MRTLILFNPNSGRGRGQRVAQSVRDLLASRGTHADLFPTAKEPPDAFHARLSAALNGLDLLIVAGGDGTLHSTLPSLLNTGTPVYHLAMGTENLFARQFRMDRSPETLDRAIKAWRTLDVDAATVQLSDPHPHPFILMCSLGPDASVIRRLDAARRGPISHLSYLKPILSEVLAPAIPRLTLEVDGALLTDNQPGMAIIANSRQYAMRIDPACNASMTDGLLDVVFFPAKTRFHLPAWVALSRLRLHRRAGVLYRQGRSVRVTCDATASAAPAYQLDGECGRHPIAPGSILTFSVQPGALRVLAP
jgi:diacylglycerol kinase (ATP)